MVRSGSGAAKMESGKMELDIEGSKFYLYETDALKVVPHINKSLVEVPFLQMIKFQVQLLRVTVRMRLLIQTRRSLVLLLVIF